MGAEVVIRGIGIHPFGRHPGVSGLQMGVAAARAALVDAGLDWPDIDVAFGGSYAAGNADAVVAHLGLTGLPFTNIFTGCATGASALILAADAVRSGEAEFALALGFDKHPPGSFDPDPADWGLGTWYGELGFMLPTQFMAMTATRYLHQHGGTEATFAKVAARAFRNGAASPTAWRRTAWSEEEVAASPMLNDPLTQYMFCSPSEGAIGVIVARSQGPASDRPVVHLRAASVKGRRFGSFEVWRPWLAHDPVPGPSVDTAKAVFARAGIAPSEVKLAQLQDTSSSTEVIAMAECGLCNDGEQEVLVGRGATEIRGSLPINTDGGCLANGEPIGASALRQVYESVLQLRGEAGARQVPGAPDVAFTHVYGAPGISACCLLTTS